MLLPSVGNRRLSSSCLRVRFKSSVGTCDAVRGTRLAIHTSTRHHQFLVYRSLSQTGLFRACCVISKISKLIRIDRIKMPCKSSRIRGVYYHQSRTSSTDCPSLPKVCCFRLGETYSLTAREWIRTPIPNRPRYRPIVRYPFSPQKVSQLPSPD